MTKLKRQGQNGLKFRSRILYWNGEPATLDVNRYNMIGGLQVHVMSLAGIMLLSCLVRLET